MAEETSTRVLVDALPDARRVAEELAAVTRERDGLRAALAVRERDEARRAHRVTETVRANAEEVVAAVMALGAARAARCLPHNAVMRLRACEEDVGALADRLYAAKEEVEVSDAD